jgi:hypothetical protein
LRSCKKNIIVKSGFYMFFEGQRFPKNNYEQTLFFAS